MGNQLFKLPFIDSNRKYVILPIETASKLTGSQIIWRDIDNTWAGQLGEKSVHILKRK